MSSADTGRPSGRPVTGTPLDYSGDLYGFYVETADVGDTPERVLRNFLGPRHAQRLRRVAHGFQFAAPIQCAPDLLRVLTQENIAIYQPVRPAKVEVSGEGRKASEGKQRKKCEEFCCHRRSGDPAADG